MGEANSIGADSAVAIHWTVRLEEYFASTGEKAHCLSWVHKQSEALYSNRRNWIDLPVIVGSGVIAFLILSWRARDHKVVFENPTSISAPTIQNREFPLDEDIVGITSRQSFLRCSTT